MKKSVKAILLFILLLFITTLVVYENKAPIKGWYTQQIKTIERDCKLRMLKQQSLDLQQKYGPEGALEA